MRIAMMMVLGLAAASAVAAAPQGQPPKVVAGRPVTMTETEPKRYVGAVETVRKVDLMPRVTGNLLKVHFVEGAMVKEGDLLYEIEDTTYRASVESLKAQRLEIEAALRFAELEHNRSKTLLKSNAVAMAAYDKSVLEIDSARAKLKQISALLTDAENNLSYTRIFAPLTGKIGKNVFSEGNLVTPQGGKLNDIEMIAPIYVRFSLSERVFRRDFGGPDGIREKAVVKIQLPDDTVYPETARVTLIDNKINASTNTLAVWATFENRDGKLLPGGFATVRLSVKPENPLIAIPPSALIAEEGGYAVYLLDAENRVLHRKIRTGDLSGEQQIILEGLDGSELVVIDGTNKVKPGMTVVPVSPDELK